MLDNENPLCYDVIKINNNLKVLDNSMHFDYNINRGRENVYDIYYYMNRQGDKPVENYLRELSLKNDKDSRIKLRKCLDYIDALSEYGLSLREPHLKQIEGINEKIYELRPSNARIFFVAWVDNSFVLLHAFLKKSQKTPKREIEKAQREFADLIERGLEYDE